MLEANYKSNMYSLEDKVTKTYPKEIQKTENLNDTQGLLSDEFDYLIDNLKEQGLIKEEAGIEEERDDLINIVGNVFKILRSWSLKITKVSHLR